MIIAIARFVPTAIYTHNGIYRIPTKRYRMGCNRVYNMGIGEILAYAIGISNIYS
jgi:hypothetical protein